MTSDLNVLMRAPLQPLIPAERRVIRNLAGALCSAMSIHQGFELVPVLGFGGERTNQEAMKTWVYCQLVNEDPIPGREALPDLLDKLQALVDEMGGGA